MCSILSLNFILSSPATTKELPGKSTKAIHAASHYSCASFCGRIVCLTWVAFGFIFFLIHSDKTTKGNMEPLFNLLVPVLPSVSSCHPVVVASLLQPIPPFGVPQVLGPPLVWFMFCLRMSPLLTFLLCLFNVCCIFRPAVSDTFICWTFSFVPCLPENKPLPKKKYSIFLLWTFVAYDLYALVQFIAAFSCLCYSGIALLGPTAISPFIWSHKLLCYVWCPCVVHLSSSGSCPPLFPSICIVCS